MLEIFLIGVILMMHMVFGLFYISEPGTYLGTPLHFYTGAILLLLWVLGLFVHVLGLFTNDFKEPSRIKRYSKPVSVQKTTRLQKS